MLRSFAPITVAARPAGPYHSPRGFTLVELLVASTIGLMVMASLATLLGLFSRTASSTQSIIDMTHRMRVVGDRLRKDLAGVTCNLEPPVSPDSDSGYFELIEGPAADSRRYNGAKAWVPSDAVGDFDDVLLFTTRNPGEPFVGRRGDSTVNAHAAEVAWFLKQAATQPVAGVTAYDLYRKQLLVCGYLGVPPFISGTNRVPVSGTAPFLDFYRDYDVSVRFGEVTPPPNQTTVLYPNTLGDLTKRENRFNRRVTWPFNEPFPFQFQGTSTLQATFDGTARAGEDVVLRNVVSFDVRVFDPDAPIKISEVGNAVLTPGDPAYVHNKNIATSARGSYVDLGWGSWDNIWPQPPPLQSGELLIPIDRPAWTASIPTFSFDIVPGTTSITVNPPFTNRFPGATATAFQLFGMHWVNRVQTGANLVPTRNLTAFPLHYDTWSTHYESNGINEDGDFEPDGVTPLVDEGSDGRDNNGDGIPDDPAERETSPPYPVPLRGVEVRIRCIEPTTKEIRQITIRHAFQ